MEARQHLSVLDSPIFRRIAAVLIAVSYVVSAPPDSVKAADPTKATTSRAARQDSIKSIPMDKLDAKSRHLVSEVVSKPSIFRRMPVAVVDCEPNLYLFMVRNPEVIVNIWGVMGISNVSMKRIGAGVFQASDGAGTLCNIRFMHTSPDTHVIYADGSYRGPLLRQGVRAKCVLVLKSGYVRETNGRHYVTSRMDVFMRVDNIGVELLAKTVQPLVGRSADHNFTETAAFLASVSRTARRNNKGLQGLAAKLTKVTPAVRTGFVRAVAKVDSGASGKSEAAKTAAAKKPSAVEPTSATIRPAGGQSPPATAIKPPSTLRR